MNELYDLIVAKSAQGENINWAQIVSYVPDSRDIGIAIARCAFWGVAIDDLPSNKYRKQWATVEPMMAITVPSKT